MQTLGKMFHIYDTPPATNATPGQTPVQLKFSAGTSRSISSRFHSRPRSDTDSYLTLVPMVKVQSSSRKSRAAYDEEANAQGIVQHMSFSILKAEKGREKEGNSWKVEAEEH